MPNNLSTLALPTVHSNGTGRPQLIEQNREAVTAIRRAIDALYAAAPHGRDYGMPGSAAYSVARDEHVARLRALEKIKNELAEIYCSVRKEVV